MNENDFWINTLSQEYFLNWILCKKYKPPFENVER